MKFILFVLALGISFSSFAQWTGQSSSSDLSSPISRTGSISTGTISLGTNAIQFFGAGGANNQIQSFGGATFGTWQFKSPYDNIVLDAGLGAGNERRIYLRTAGSDRMMIDYDGKVGIGTTSPLSKLHVSGLEGNSFRLYKDGNTSNYLSLWQGTSGAAIDPIATGLLYLGYSQSTKVIIGNGGGSLSLGTNPIQFFGAGGANNQIQSFGGASVGSWKFSSSYDDIYFEAGVDASNQRRIFFRTAGADRMLIDNSGNVGIGTSTPGSFRLAVNGKIWGTEVQVAVNNPGPDYVFEKDYALPSLESVKTYIDQNKHLPEVPSAKEMEANGINLSEMNMLLLKKVEELTLYVIELKKENEEFKKSLEKVIEKK